MLAGLVAIRKMHIRAILESGFTCADEMLYPENYRYLSDILSYVAVGARSVEDQQHRLTVSGMDVPAGMKNPTSGDFSVMLNSVVAAQGAHRFIYRSWEVETSGNELAHTILRGAVNKHGEAIPNYHYEDLRLLWEKYQEKSLKNPAVIVDTNHSNSNKQYEQQVRIAKEVLHSRLVDPHLSMLVKGLMIESYIEPGNQKSAATISMANQLQTHALAGKNLRGFCILLRKCADISCQNKTEYFSMKPERTPNSQ